jgi:hypothetical protein
LFRRYHEPIEVPPKPGRLLATMPGMVVLGSGRYEALSGTP